MSLASLAFSFILGLTISTTVSIAVLNNSPDITTPKRIIHVNHSDNDILNNTPNSITSVIITICIFIFLSDLKALYNP